MPGPPFIRDEWHFRAIGRHGSEAYSFGTGLPAYRLGVSVTTIDRRALQGRAKLKRSLVAKRLQQFWNDERGQDIAEYAVMLAVILVIVVGTIRLIGSNANNVFSQVGSAIQ
jgi:Flp pilus assembly pilin Flp